MVRAIQDEALIDAVLAESGRQHQWRGLCHAQDIHAGTRYSTRLRWRDGGEIFVALRHRQPCGEASTILLSAPAGRDGEMQITAAADCLDAEFSRASAGFARLLEALRR